MTTPKDMRALDLSHRRLCYPEQVCMRVLFTISMLALIALLWASISIARHIYRVRQRHRNNKSTTDVIVTQDTQQK